jgi:stage IV sporulation protein FB
VEFRLGSIPVKVHGFFFLTALFLGGDRRDPIALLIWVAVVFVSVLVHELGHALVGKAFGLSPRIDLHGMGGLTSWAPGPRLGNGKHIAVSLAGPFAGFSFGVVAFALLLLFNPSNPIAQNALGSLLWVNIGWGIFNLLPMLPLDGGNVMRSVIASVTKGNGERGARIASVVVAVGCGALALLARQWWMLMLVVLYAFNNVQALRQLGRIDVDKVLVASIENAYKALESHDGKTAIALLRPALVPNASRELREVGTRLYAYGLLIEGQWGELMKVLEADAELVGGEELEKFARAARGTGRLEEAERIEGFAKTKASLAAFRA